jgi:long-subunit fatty acid transport protein
MKKLTIIALSLMVTVSSVIAGGLVTNTNQSAAWARTLTREASLGVDAVYFNPAGLAQLKNGLHLSLSNQSIFQTRTITNNFAGLNNGPESLYEAELAAPLFPSVYAAFKLDKWAFSAGFNIIGGGGTASFEQGIPSIEMNMLTLAPTVNAIMSEVDAGVEAVTGVNPMFATTSGYNMDAAFSGSSTYMGFQLGATYAINDMISVAIGGRYVSAKNTYEGSLDATINTAAHMGGAPSYAGDYILTAAGLVGAGEDPTLNFYADALNKGTKGATVDAVQTGSGFTPIIGVNLHLTDMINIAAKYEHHTKIELTNETTNDDVNMFPDKAKTRGDLPGMFSLGAQLKPIDKLSASVGFNYFLDKSAYYGDYEVDADGNPVMADDDISFVQVNNEGSIDDNAWSMSACVEYKFLGIMGASVGYSFGNLGVNNNYQSDLSYANQSSTIGGGVFVHLGEMIILNAGVVYVMYDDSEKPFTSPAPYNEIYGKKTTIFSIGLDISL